MKVIWTKVAYFCKGCGALAYRATVPPEKQPEDYCPAGECGRCGSTLGFTIREAA